MYSLVTPREHFLGPLIWFWVILLQLFLFAGIAEAQGIPGPARASIIADLRGTVGGGIVGGILDNVKSAVAELMDTAPESISDEVKEIAEAVPQVQNCHAIRVRSVGAEVFIDAHVVLEGSLSLSEAHRIVDAVEDAVRHRIPKADITVHAEPPEAAGN